MKYAPCSDSTRTGVDCKGNPRCELDVGLEGEVVPTSLDELRKCPSVKVFSHETGPPHKTLVLHIPGRDLPPDRSLDSFWKSLEEIKLMVVVSHYLEDSAWMERIPFPYTIMSKTLVTENFVADNKVFEAIGMLDYIAEFYDHLPTCLAFVGGDQVGAENSSHLGDLVEILKNICLKDEFIPLGRKLMLGESNLKEYEKEWNKTDGLFAKYGLPQLKTNSIKTISWDGSEFIVHRKRVKALPREFYRGLSDWFKENPKEKNINYLTPWARYMRYSWHMIFGEKPWMIDLDRTLKDVSNEYDLSCGGDLKGRGLPAR